MASCEISKEQMLAVLGELEQFKAWEWTADEQAGVDAIRALIESGVKITTVGGGLFSHYPQGRAKQTEGSESSGERAAPPAKEGGSVSGADIEVMAGARYGDRNTISKRPVEVDKASPGLSPTAPSGERPAPPQPAKVTRAWVDELLTVVVLQPFIHEVHGSHRPKCIDAMISKFRSIGIRVEGEPEGGSK